MARQTEIREAAKAAIDAAMSDEPELIGRPKKNGPPPRETFGRGLAEFDQLAAERDELERELKMARERIRLLEIQVDQLEGMRDVIERRINDCVRERDQAVRESGELKGVLNSVASICVRYHHAQQDQE